MVLYSNNSANHFWQRFPSNKKQAFLVIHARDQEQVMKNYHISKHAGADGVFLINHGKMNNAELLNIYAYVRERFPDDFIGINFLNLTIEEIIQIMPLDVSGLWIDDGGFGTASAKNNFDLLRNYRQGCLLFSSIYFKYIDENEDISKAKIDAGCIFSDCLVTSGPATGKPPKPQKIRVIKSLASKHPIGIASGMTVENVSSFFDADFFLVSTGISDGNDNFIPELAMQFVNRVQAMEKEEA